MTMGKLSAAIVHGHLEMNVYKPLMISNIAQSITLLTDGCTNFRKFLIEGTRLNRGRIDAYVRRSLMLVTALAPVIATTRCRRSRTTPWATISP
jgi:fumarate hydratase class II